MGRPLQWLWSEAAAVPVMVGFWSISWLGLKWLHYFAFGAFEMLEQVPFGASWVFALAVAMLASATIAFVTALGLRFRRRLLLVLALLSPAVIKPLQWSAEAAMDYSIGVAFIERGSFVGVPYEGDYRGIDEETRIPIRDHRSSCGGLEPMEVHEYRVHNATLRTLHWAFGPMPGSHRAALPTLDELRTAVAASSQTVETRPGYGTTRVAMMGRLEAHRSCYAYDRIVCRIHVIDRKIRHTVGIFGYEPAQWDEAERDLAEGDLDKLRPRPWRSYAEVLMTTSAH